jgi:hypothetical protein
MLKKRFSTEPIVTLHRQIEGLMAEGKTAPVARGEIDAELRDELLNGEIFYNPN